MTNCYGYFISESQLKQKIFCLDIKELTLFLNIKIHTKYTVQQTAYLQEYIFECNEDF